MKNAEIWLCRVLLHRVTKKPLRQQELQLDEHQSVIGKIISGDFGSLEDGTIVEPISAHETEPLANEARLRAIRDSPGVDFRVVITVKL